MNISYLLGRSSQAHPSGDTGLHATDIADFSLEATAHRLRHYRDIQLPGMTGKVPPLKELTHPSKLNKRSHSSKVGGEGVELEEEPSRQRCRFDNTEVKGYLADLKRKQMVLRQDSNPQEVPGSPVLPLHLSSSSSAGFRVDEMGGEYPSLHHNSELTLADHQPGPVSTKELISIMREDSKITAAGYGAAGGGTCSFPTRSPTTSSTLHHHPPQFSSIISELDPSLEHLLGGTVSPAVASTPSPNATTTTTATKTSRSPIASSSSPPPPIPPMSSIPSVRQLHRYLDASEGEGEIMTDIVCDGGGKEEESPEIASVSVVAAAGGGDDRELVEDLSEMPILPSFRDQGQLHTSPTSLPYVLPNDPPPPSLSLLLSQAFSNHNTITYPSQANLHSDTRGSQHERFNATTFSISQYYPREE